MKTGAKNSLNPRTGTTSKQGKRNPSQTASTKNKTGVSGVKQSNLKSKPKVASQETSEKLKNGTSK